MTPTIIHIQNTGVGIRGTKTNKVRSLSFQGNFNISLHVENTCFLAFPYVFKQNNRGWKCIKHTVLHDFIESSKVPYVKKQFKSFSCEFHIGRGYFCLVYSCRHNCWPDTQILSKFWINKWISAWFIVSVQYLLKEQMNECTCALFLGIIQNLKWRSQRSWFIMLILRLETS